MSNSNDHKNRKKINIMKLYIFSFILFMIFAYEYFEADDQSFVLSQTAFLYEGDELVGVNTGENAETLTTEQNTKAEQAIAKLETEDDAELSTKVVNTPSLISFDIPDKEQAKTIDYAKQQTKVLDEGYTVIIDDKHKYYIQDLDTVDWTLDHILLSYVPDKSYLDYYQSTGKFKPYTEGERKYTSVGITNEIKVVEGYQTGSRYIENDKQLLFDLFHDDQTPIVDYVSDDKSIQSIKDDNKMSDTEFKINNPDVTENAVAYNGQEVVTNQLDPVIEVVQVFETTETKEVDYEVVKKEDDTLAQGQVKIEVAGEAGEMVVTYENQVVNGEVVSTNKVSEKVTKKPVHEVQIVGTKVFVPVVSAGSGSGTSSGSGSKPSSGSGTSNASDFTPAPTAGGFIWPSSSRRVTCEVGCYPGHVGIDIQSYYGGPIYASKAGVVTTSGWSGGGYGYYVVINHGGGVTTLYAHQSQQPPVSVGQNVSQGQVIGFEGASGNVTGEHLHFEIRINGTAVNPRNYI